MDFVLAYPEADVECEIYMKRPGGIDFGPIISGLFQFLKLVKNIYHLKQAGWVWSKQPTKGYCSSSSINRHMIHASSTEAVW